jgi:putative transposase
VKCRRTTHESPQPNFLPDVPLHVVQRGHNRSNVFFTDADHHRYRGWLRRAATDHKFAIHGYALMTNHVHLLVTPAHEDTLARVFKSLNLRYVRHINARENRTGTIWEGRHRAALIDSDAYFLTCLRYIELNPMRAGIVADPGEYPWSSYAWHGDGIHDELITDHPLYLSLGPRDADRQRVYRDMVRSALPDDLVKSIRSATHAGTPLGDNRFAARVSRASTARKDARPRLVHPEPSR